MPDQHASPDEGGSSERNTPHGAPTSPAESLRPRDPRTDIPARLASEAHPADAEEGALTDEEIALYRRRVAEGFYNSREVAAEVARRLLRSPDI
jgi:hypothetical protein